MNFNLLNENVLTLLNNEFNIDNFMSEFTKKESDIIELKYKDKENNIVATNVPNAAQLSEFFNLSLTDDKLKEILPSDIYDNLKNNSDFQSKFEKAFIGLVYKYFNDYIKSKIINDSDASDQSTWTSKKTSTEIEKTKDEIQNELQDKIQEIKDEIPDIPPEKPSVLIDNDLITTDENGVQIPKTQIKIWAGTQEQYDNLVTNNQINENTLYFIKDDNGGG